MTEFKVGDKVRLTGRSWPSEGGEFGVGTIHTVTEIDPEGDPVIGDATTVGEYYILPDDGYGAELVEESPEPPLAPWEKAILEFSNGQTATSKEDIESIARLGDHLGIYPTSFEGNVCRHTDRIAEMLIEKNQAYGDSALNPVRVFSKADREEQLYVRIDDKISRIQRGTEFANEDTIDDLIGYLILLKIAKESA